MKNWMMPMAVAQQFAANEYVSACYRIYCQSPQGNATVMAPKWDTNNNGVYDDTDEYIVTPPSWSGGLIYGCDGYHDVTGEAAPTNNSLVLLDGESLPVFSWFGSVIGSVDGAIEDFHFADLSAENAIIDDGNKS